MDEIIFGTDGWRDVIADKFNFSNLARASQAYADYAKRITLHKVVIGFDTRFNGALFARKVAEVLAANGLEVLLAKDYLPTPALSFAVKHYQAGGGIMITASHNPPSYSGFKLKGPYGGTATPDIYQGVSSRVNQIKPQDIAIFQAKTHEIQTFDIREAYYQQLKSLSNLEVLKSFKGYIVHEAMGGAASGWFKDFFSWLGLADKLIELHPKPDPLFYGVNPEPIAQNLAEAMAFMQTSDAKLLVATDGDADRLGQFCQGSIF
ncbi:MAG: hypothetical protein R2880_21065 [Deinococcales bacterium]